MHEGDSNAEAGPLHVWIFHSEKAQFASGVFKDRDTALQWVAMHELTGIVTEYPVGVGCYDLAVAEGLFHPSMPHHGSPRYVAGFSPPGDHIHVRDGRPAD